MKLFIRSTVYSTFRIDIFTDNRNKIVKVETQGDNMIDYYLDLILSTTLGTILDNQKIKDIVNKKIHLYIIEDDEIS